MERRDWMKAFGTLAAGGVVYVLTAPAHRVQAGSRAVPGGPAAEQHPARYYTRLEGKAVRCDLCFRQCRIAAGNSGFCRNRVNDGGSLYTTVYGRPSAVNVEPTEKEPMHHFLPGSNMLCIGTASCNFRCQFCHNWHLSQHSVDEVTRRFALTPAEAVRLAQRRGVPSISFTYNEPTVFYEYMYDVAEEAQAAGVRIIFHSNGGMRPEPLKDILQYTDAVTMDLKGFRDEYYQRLCEARLDPVLESLKIVRQEGVWLEIVNLVLPGYNDDTEELQSMCRWIRAELGPDVPLHFSRFSPAYKMTHLTPTPVATLEGCRDIAHEEGIRYVSIGNVPGHRDNSSFCPQCGELIIERFHFSVGAVNLDDGRCTFCDTPIPGIWE